MPVAQAFNQNGLRRLAMVLLRTDMPASPDAGRTALLGSLGPYAPDMRMIDRIIGDYFRTRG